METYAELCKKDARNEVERLWYDLHILTQDHVCATFRYAGLRLKTSDHYMTKEGYPLGTQCWFIQCEIKGRRKFICGDTQEDCLRAAIEYFRKAIERISADNKSEPQHGG